MNQISPSRVSWVTCTTSCSNNPVSPSLRFTAKVTIKKVYITTHQKAFEAVVNIMYNYYLEKILLTISRYLVNQDQLVRLIYKAVKAYPFSIVFHIVSLIRTFTTYFSGNPTRTKKNPYST